MVVPGVFDGVEDLVGWHSRLAGLRTFWTGRFMDYRLLPEGSGYVVWWRKRACREAVFYLHTVGGGREGGGRCVFLYYYRGGLAAGSYSRWSVVYFYSSRGVILEPNNDAVVEIYDSLEEGILEHVERVQRSSWGFYVPPREGSIVFLARIDGRVVGSAYFHVASRNVDYGVHVDRRYWRRRIGTSLLNAVAGYARGLGFEWFSVVRVLRGVQPTASDRRAMGFYEANGPIGRLYVYRLLPRP